MADGLKKWTLYVHITPNNKYYVGITCQEIEKRWQNGLGYRKQPLFFNAILKYGWDNIQHRIIKTDLSESEAKKLEQKLIKKLDSFRYNGYNLTLGGEGTVGKIVSEETKQKISNSKIGISCNKGKSNGMYGVRGKDTPSSKPVICITTGQIYETMSNACNDINRSLSSLSGACSGRQKTCGELDGIKLEWRWYNG